MQSHQKYLPTFDKKNNLTNNFFVVSDIKDTKGFVKLGNERVIEARLSDAEFFWEKNKTQNLVKQVDKLKNINYFKGLGSYFDKIQRMRKLSSVISDDFLISKDKIEIASSICKVDLMSDLVGEFPELQGIVGGHFARFQGFDKEVCLAVSEQYLPNGMESKLPKKMYSVALSLSDKLDSLVGFFGINLKPTSSKDPYAIRRMAISLVRLIVENEIKKLDDNDVAIMVYTSGTTGPPKGSMITHGNLRWVATQLPYFPISNNLSEGDSQFLSYLPLCHVFGRLIDLLIGIHLMATINFAESIDTVQADLAEIQPTIFPAVPRILEKMHSGAPVSYTHLTLPTKA